MFPVPTRREFFHVLLGAAGALTSRAGISAQGVEVESLRVTRLAPHLVLLSGAPGNVVAASGPEGAVVVNGGSAARSREVLSAIARETGTSRIHTLVNTDWHPDHTGSNAAVTAAGGAVLAHEFTRQYLGTELHVDWQERTYAPQPKAAHPTATVRTAGTLPVGTETVEYGPLGPAHTDGDLYVFFRDANVLVVGDTMTVGAYPIADYASGGWLGGLTTATKTLVDLANDGTRVVPGTGSVQTRADLQAQFEMLSALRDRLVKMMRQGMGAEDMLAAGVTKDFDARWGSPNLFVSTAYRGLWLHVRELGGVV